jgi:hypothetical protein
MNDTLSKALLLVVGSVLVYSPTVYVYYLTQKTTKRIDEIESHVHDMKEIEEIKLTN